MLAVTLPRAEGRGPVALQGQVLALETGQILSQENGISERAGCYCMSSVPGRPSQ